MSYTCRVCGKKFEKPEAIGPGLGYASPCCRNHFHDSESEEDGRPCSSDCCDEVEAEDAKAFDYKGKDIKK